MKLLIATAAALALSGCALTPPVRQVTSQRIFVPLDSQATSPTLLSVLREQGNYGAGCSSRVFLDGQLIMQVEQGEQASVPVQERANGSHQVKLTHFGACASGSQELSVPNGNLSLRITPNGRSVAVARSS